MLRRVAGEQEEVVDRDRPVAVRPGRLHDGVEGDERDRDVGRVGRDAVLARAEDGVPAVEAVERGAARCPARACCRARRRRGSRRSGSAGTGCRPSTPCCGAARTRRAAAPPRSPGSARRRRGCAPRRSSAPARRSAAHRPGRSSTPGSGSALMSTSRSGGDDTGADQVDLGRAAGEEGARRARGHPDDRRRGPRWPGCT